MKRLLILVLLVALLGACASDPPRFESIEALTAAARESGVCSEPEKGIAAELVRASVSCADSGVALFLFENERDLVRWTEVGARLEPTAAGPNWAASGPKEEIGDLSAALKARIVAP